MLYSTLLVSVRYLEFGNDGVSLLLYNTLLVSVRYFYSADGADDPPSLPTPQPPAVYRL